MPAAQSPLPPPAHAGTDKPAQGRVLVIDDNPQNVALIRAQLERAGYEVTGALGGRVGLEAIAASQPDLVLVDIMMPGMDGYDVCRILRQDEATRALPVIVLTSLQERADKLRALEAGADDFLSKPVDRAELLARVRSLLRVRRLYDELAQSRDEIAEWAGLLAAEKSRAEGILYSISEGVVTTDPEERITLMTPAAEAMFGVTLEAALGQPWATALMARGADGQALDETTSPVREVLSTNRPTGLVDARPSRPDGREMVFGLTAAPIRQAGGEVIGVVLVCRDITRQRELERMKREFVTLVSHELRTPMASMFGFAELLLHREPLTEKGRGYAETLYRETQRLLNLVNDFLDVERLESGAVAYRSRPLALTEVLDDVEDSFRDQMDKHHLERDLPAPPLVVQTDRDRLLQVLINLISNAIKYSPGGGTIRIGAQRQAGDVVISVQDQGLGFTPEAGERLFEKFYRVDSPEFSGIGGTGLGLAICKRIIEGSGGRIWAESAGPGSGATFSFTQPLAATPPPETPATVPAAARGRVLVVKDDPSLAALIREQLTGAGYQVESVATGEAALERARAEPPAAVVLDIGLAGELDGWAVLATLRDDPACADAPVIMVSGREEQARALAVGANDYLVKPVPAERLISSVRRLAGPPAAGRPVLIADDDPAMRKLVGETLRGSGFEVVEAGDGEEALARIREVTPLALVLDLLMPRLDGFQVLEALQEQPDFRDIPVLVLTGKQLSPEERLRLAAQAEGLVEKSASSGSDISSALARVLPASAERAG
ncbi:MAG: response regulator [Chloroflexota bacterium]